MVLRKVVITGPESTGKTVLADNLASHFNALRVPEYAREYVSRLDRKYNYEDVECIAREQLRQEKLFSEKATDLLFFDTYLVVTKVWFREVFGRYPGWLDEAMENSGIDLFLVCDTDIPWIPDPVRENGGERREVLKKLYIDEINFFDIPWKLVTGKAEHRACNAIEAVNGFLAADRRDN
ncbi:MAG: ATP-binding protein [Bacteroidales bacterium]